MKKQANRESKSYEFFVRQHYHMLPTDPRFLRMTREQVINEFWMIYYFELRKKNPGKADETEFDGSEAFNQAMEEAGLRQDDETGEWVEVDPDEIEVE